jgi:hypothetical protein
LNPARAPSFCTCLISVENQLITGSACIPKPILCWAFEKIEEKNNLVNY